MKLEWANSISHWFLHDVERGADCPNKVTYHPGNHWALVWKEPDGGWRELEPLPEGMSEDEIKAFLLAEYRLGIKE